MVTAVLLDHRFIRLGSIAALITLWILLEFMGIDKSISVASQHAPHQQEDPVYTQQLVSTHQAQQADVATDVAENQNAAVGGDPGGADKEGAGGIGEEILSKTDVPGVPLIEKEGETTTTPGLPKGPSNHSYLTTYLSQWGAVDDVAVTWRGAPWKREVGLWLNRFGGTSEEVEIEEVLRKCAVLIS